MKTQNINNIKEVIVNEIETSCEPVTAGTIAVKYGIPYVKSAKAIKQLKKDGILE